MKKYVYVDLDETLIHSTPLHGSIPPDFVARPGEIMFDTGTPQYPDVYHSIQRPGSAELLYCLRQLVGAENVFMLTVATIDYALPINRGFQLGFPDDQIYAREHLHGNSKYRQVKRKSDPEAKAYLLDNLPRYELGGKLAFIHQFGGIRIDQTYHWKISDFLPAEDALPLSPEDIQNILLYIRGDSK